MTKRQWYDLERGDRVRFHSLMVHDGVVIATRPTVQVRWDSGYVSEHAINDHVRFSFEPTHVEQACR